MLFLTTCIRRKRFNMKRLSSWTSELGRLVAILPYFLELIVTGGGTQSADVSTLIYISVIRLLRVLRVFKILRQFEGANNVQDCRNFIPATVADVCDVAVIFFIGVTIHF